MQAKEFKVKYSYFCTINSKEEACEKEYLLFAKCPLAKHISLVLRSGINTNSNWLFWWKRCYICGNETRYLQHYKSRDDKHKFCFSLVVCSTVFRNNSQFVWQVQFRLCFSKTNSGREDAQQQDGHSEAQWNWLGWHVLFLVMCMLNEIEICSSSSRLSCASSSEETYFYRSGVVFQFPQKWENSLFDSLQGFFYKAESLQLLGTCLNKQPTLLSLSFWKVSILCWIYFSLFHSGIIFCCLCSVEIVCQLDHGISGKLKFCLIE